MRPFGRARLLAAQIAAIVQELGPGFASRDAIAALGPYRSRGHGRGSPLGAGYAIGDDNVARPVSRSKYEPHQGRREMMRRMLGGFAGRRAPQYGVNT